MFNRAHRQRRSFLKAGLVMAAGGVLAACQPALAGTGTPDAESLLYARAAAPDGRTAEAWLRTGEGYAYTAASAVSTVEEVLTAPPIGATTVAAAYGPRVALAAGGEILAPAQPG